tara:strand:- start:384 stop:548 length:165 start_codon:yes stop_codon:yes gene_type:complete
MLKDYFDESDNKKIQFLGVERQRDKEKKKPDRKKQVNPYTYKKDNKQKKIKKKK